MARVPFRDRLNSGKVILFDGGMGTELYKRGTYINKCFDELNLSNPSLIREVHEEYIKAGAEVIETNTYGANRYKLSGYGYQESIYDINFQAAQIAREAAGEDVYVAGSIG